MTRSLSSRRKRRNINTLALLLLMINFTLPDDDWIQSYSSLHIVVKYCYITFLVFVTDKQNVDNKLLVSNQLASIYSVEII